MGVLERIPYALGGDEEEKKDAQRGERWVKKSGGG